MFVRCQFVVQALLDKHIQLFLSKRLELGRYFNRETFGQSHLLPKLLGFGVWGLGFGVWGLGFGVWGLGVGVWGHGDCRQTGGSHPAGSRAPGPPPGLQDTGLKAWARARAKILKTGPSRRQGRRGTGREARGSGRNPGNRPL